MYTLKSTVVAFTGPQTGVPAAASAFPAAAEIHHIRFGKQLDRLREKPERFLFRRRCPEKRVDRFNVVSEFLLCRFNGGVSFGEDFLVGSVLHGL